MKKALKDLYYGKINGLGIPLDKMPRYREAQSQLCQVEKKLQKRLDKEGMSLLSQYSDLEVEMEVLMGQADFIHGFRTGARLMAEVFSEAPEKDT